MLKPSTRARLTAPVYYCRDNGTDGEFRVGQSVEIIDAWHDDAEPSGWAADVEITSGYHVGRRFQVGGHEIERSPRQPRR